MKKFESKRAEKLWLLWMMHAANIDKEASISKIKKK